MMKAKDSGTIQLRIPFYRQHYDFTCGPAALMMALKYFDKRLPLSKNLEMDIWREGSMVEVYGTSRFGLAYSAAVRGFKASVTSNTGKIDFVDRLVPPLEGLNTDMLKLLFEERRNRCRKLGVEERKESITAETIRGSLQSGHVPLIITTALFSREENLPHWVTLTGLDSDFVYFNNPLYADAQKRRFDLTSFEKVVGYQGGQSMVEIWK